MASVTCRARVVTAIASAQIARPQTVDDVRAAMHDALERREPLRICGAGTWRDAGPPVDAARTLSLAALSGIIAYVPGDLTITAWAGTTMAELSHATAAHGQWLGLDPAGDRGGTIGATIATASSGPLAHAFGTPRDLVLGLDAVTGYGDVVRAGGRVVKNVAGFDLVRLYTGSWGTLGAITAVTMRLRALPIHDMTLAIALDGDAHLTALLSTLRENTISLLACEFIDGRTARDLHVTDGRDALLLRLGGNDGFIRGQRALLENIASAGVTDAAVWGSVSRLDRDACAVVRVSGTASELSSRIRRIRTAIGDAGARDVALHGSVHRGMVRIVASGDASCMRDALLHTASGEQRVVERLPVSWWRDVVDPFDGALAGRIRAAFDPARLCNRRTAAHA